jgi:hypothetical protein
MPKQLTAKSWPSATQRALCFGVQFHPESIGSQHGKTMLANFLKKAGREVSDAVRSAISEARRRRSPEPEEIDGGVRGDPRLERPSRRRSQRS